MKMLSMGLLLAVAAATGAFGLPSLSQFSLELPAPNAPFEEVFTGYQFFMGGELDGDVTMTASYDPGLKHWMSLVSSDFFRNTAVCDGNGGIVSGDTEVMSGKLEELMGMDRRTVEVRDGNLVLQFLRNGKKVNDKRIALDRPILDVDTMPLLLSEFLKKTPASFNSDIVLKSRGWRVNVNFTYLKPGSGEIASESGDLPKQYRHILSGFGKAVHCFRMQAAGILGVLDSTKYYFLFADDDERHFIGFWGGRGKTAEGMIFGLPGEGGRPQ